MAARFAPPIALLPLIALVALVSCQDAPQEGGGGGPQGPQPALVESVIAEPGSLSHTWRSLADVVSLGNAELAAGAAGPVTSARVREGDRVEAGALLMEVDRAIASAQYASAQAGAAEARATLELARSDLERLGQVGGEVLAPSEMDTAKAQVAQLGARVDAQDAALRLAQERLSRHRLSAPFGGIITDRRVDPGDWVQEGQAVFSIVSVDELELRAHVAPEIARGISVGETVTIRGPSPLTGTVHRVVPVLDPNRRTALIRITPDATAPWLVPGAAVEVELGVNVEGDDAARVPRDALVLGPSSTRVVIDKQGVASPVEVEVLATSETQALVRGVRPGDRVVVKGNERVRPGQPLRYAFGGEGPADGPADAAAPGAPEGAGHE